MIVKSLGKSSQIITCDKKPSRCSLAVLPLEKIMYLKGREIESRNSIGRVAAFYRKNNKCDKV
jgi:hypothetical protein